MFFSPLQKRSFILFISVLTFLTVSAIGIYWAHLSQALIEKEHDILLNQIATTQASSIERRLTLSLAATQVISQEVIQAHGDLSNFDRIAENTLSSIGGINNLQLAPDGVITKIFPLEGNESAIGLNILKHPVYREATLHSIKNKKLMVAGPFQLVQGGIALLGRNPVFLMDQNGQETFWGFVSAMIYLDDLLQSTELYRLADQGYLFQLSRIPPESKEAIVFVEPIKAFVGSTVTAPITIPSGNWTLTIGRNQGLDTQYITQWYLISFLIGLLSATFVYYLLRYPLKLQSLVDIKTAELHKLAYTDPLTHLPNRRLLMDKMKEAVLNIHKSHTAFIYFDIDNFKRINDSIGHDVGDYILCCAAERIQQNLQENDLVGRLGGDEFGVLLHNIKDKEQVKEWLNRLNETIKKAIIIKQKEHFISMSFGIVLMPEDGDNIVSIMQNADMAMYHAKHLGKDQYCFYSHSMKEKTLNRIHWEDDIQSAIHHREFILFYQPLFSIGKKQVIGAEALIRWNHVDKGMVAPDQFIPIAEETGQILEIGYWVIREACDYIQSRSERNLPPLTIQINLSPLQLSDPHLLPYLIQCLIETNIDPKLLGIEITETALLHDITLATQVLNKIKAMGIGIAIDDFGIGYSSLKLLKDLPFDILKIDRLFIFELETNPDDQRIVEAIIAMSHKLGLQVIAEGIETNEQLIQLQEFQCDSGQGYYLGRPVPKDDFEKKLEQPIINHV